MEQKDDKQKSVEDQPDCEEERNGETCCKTMGQVNKPLIPLKIALFGISGVLNVMRTFLYVYLERIGLSVKQIAIINSIVPVIQLIVITITGVIADKTGRAKLVLCCYLLIALVIGNAFFLFPHANAKLSSKKERNFSCSSYITNMGIRNFTCVDVSRSLDMFQNCSLKCSCNSSIELIETFCEQDANIFCGSLNSSKENIHNYCFAVELKEEVPGVEVNITNLQHCDKICKIYPAENKKNMAILMTILLCFITIVYRTSFKNAISILDATAMSLSKVYNSDYGRQRIWIALGQICMPPIAGTIIESMSTQDYPYYHIVFIVADVLMIVVILSVWKLEIKPKPKLHQVRKTFFSVLKDLDNIVFLIVVYTLSMLWGFRTDFISLYLNELKASSLLMSLVQLVYGLSGLPFMLVSNWWINKIGSGNVLVLAYVAYVLKYTAYSYLLNPWWSLLCELTAIFTFHFMWVAVVHRLDELMPAEVRQTIQGVISTLHFGIGAASGSLLGGFVMDKYGGRRACRVLAIFAFICGVLYVSYIWARRNWNKINTVTQTDEKEEKGEKVQQNSNSQDHGHFEEKQETAF